jgi:hypothetical protein
MSMMSEHAHELDVVELLEGVDRWPAGTSGTVVSTPNDRVAIVEIGPEEPGVEDLEFGDTLIRVPYEQLRVVWRNAA